MTELEQAAGRDPGVHTGPEVFLFKRNRTPTQLITFVACFPGVVDGLFSRISLRRVESDTRNGSSGPTARVRAARWVTRLWLVGAVGAVALAPAAAADASSTWTIQHSPNGPTGGGLLAGVACVSTLSCFAVGDYSDNSGNDQTLIEAWNGSAWSLDSSPNNGTVPNDLTGVSCASSSSCEAVGYSGLGSAEDQTLVESWNGTAWTIVPSPNSGPTSALSGVSCIAANSCVAVGHGSLSSTIAQTLVESWNGTAWSIVPSPDVGTNGNFLNAVSCVTATSCTAVGEYATSGGYPQLTLIESWDGTKWSVVPSPNKTTLESNSLYGVSCASVNSCIAVGEYPNAHHAASTLIESWNGTTWSIAASPNDSRGNDLFGVSCTSPKHCQAVGRGADTTLIESWNGVTWTKSASPSRSSALSSALAGVSCVSGTWCGAAGFSETPRTLRTLTELYG